jgi:hypothetical protein
MEPRGGAESGSRAARFGCVARHWAVLAIAVSLLAVTTGASAAQQSPQGGIETQTLEPVAPAQAEAGQGEPGQGTGQDLAPRDSRFKPAPFRTLGATSAPELIEPVATATRGGARLRELDKMTGRTKTFEVAAGAEATVDRLRVRLDACRAPDDNAQHGTMAFLEVWDTKRDAQEPVFSGWMFAESPALSAMDHPRYDLWVISCTTSAGETPKASE